MSAHCTRGTRGLACAALALVPAGCSGERAESAPAAAAAAVTAAPADSLLLTLGDGATVWYTHARDARAADGTACVERGLEIRRGGARVAVPLLYTRDVPVAAGDWAIETRLYLDCVPGDRYRVDTRTGQPTPIR